MKKLLFFLLFLSFYSVKAQIQINYQDNSPKIDGELNDWPSVNYSFKQTSHQVKSPNVLRYDFGFDETYLYGVFQIKDKQLTDLAKDKNGSPRLTFNDGIEFYIDTQNNSKTVMDDDDYQLIMDFMGNLTVFRGGDKYLLKVEDYKVPKDTVTNHFIMDLATRFEGTTNNEADIDSGYVIEFRISWAALGIRPHEGQTFKIDVCINDADEYLDIRPLSEEDMIPNYAFESINKKTDFGFPNNWTATSLQGSASVWKQVRKFFEKQFWIVVLIVFLLFMVLIVRILRNRKEVVTVQEKVFQVIGGNEYVATDSFQSRATNFILKNLEKEILPTNLAENLNVSLRQLQRQFKEETNATPTDFIRKVKLEEAAKRLVLGNQTISEIAYSVGFSDPAYFSRIFKKYFDKTPSEFQENAQKT
ncbi:hypothetical protein GCM10011514_43570 [Emticicia aquatilis]|uniref:HTH araC/xylS-type domain-containing protein n=1 Tax=Emticicia aquatilis TaxID=1537369 RepID=A0A916Z3U5_9BACT|nr:helix-turn-helix domain-containing protein [Emticicia aquatilis]GGD74831.1 hypothetical protein GCM10011514_43570 [Emticicia aquatilis]